jgi:hypothetical protein
MFCRKEHRLTDILSGLHIDDPAIFIPWDIRLEDIESYFNNYSLIRVTDKYYVMRGVKVFGTLACNIGLYFEKKLKRIEFFGDDYTDLNKSFNDFQVVFVKNFGKPIKRKKVPSVIISYEWNVSSKVKIYHSIMNRFGLGEYLFIEII